MKKKTERNILIYGMRKKTHKMTYSAIAERFNISRARAHEIVKLMDQKKNKESKIKKSPTMMCELALDTRAYNCFISVDIINMSIKSFLKKWTGNKLLAIPNFGVGSLIHVTRLLEKAGYNVQNLRATWDG
jgi:DNA-directed RNA polymerase alpha subunit